jgi:hypothetical protein
MTPTPEITQRVARNFARSVADRQETTALHVSVDEDEDAIVLWLETDEIGTATEVELHELAAQVNDEYPDEYILLRILNPVNYRSFDPALIRPNRAESVPLHEAVSDLNGAEDTRPH